MKTADTQESYKNGVIILVTGCLTKKENNQRRKFIQSFFLAPQDKYYFVLNDVFRYVDESKQSEVNHVVVEGIDDPPRTIDSPSPDLVSVQKQESQNVEEESLDVLKNEGPLSNEPEPHPIENNVLSMTESVSDTPKMSCASILSSQTKNAGPGPSKVYVPANTLEATSNKTENKSVEASAPIASSSISSPDSTNVHDEGDGHSIYIQILPLNATVSQLETEF